MPCPEADPALTGTQLLVPSKRAAKRCGVALDRSRQNTTGPELVATTLASSTLPMPLMPPAAMELPKPTHALAFMSKAATSIEEPVGPTEVHATIGLPPTIAMDGLAADPVALCSPVPVALPAKAVQVPPT